ncbi:hypothetical protein [Sphingomonas crocodyli]|uniref:Uncharacterized protein n=1 Tax=Sphingomonas crocodyli TaxID=1979270 RepID=A0A437LYC0_9SPHN|nr:hypothetical protein [Sphingomonas crocodyli]RVT90429.1 hypothetical protein EOD43_19420 [Sphingomonas crocodyli]
MFVQAEPFDKRAADDARSAREEASAVGQMTDVDLIKRYEAKVAGDADVDHLAREMTRRGIDFTAPDR